MIYRLKERVAEGKGKPKESARGREGRERGGSKRGGGGVMYDQSIFSRGGRRREGGL